MTHSLTDSDIKSVVDRFYAKVRRDPLLGPIFATKIENTDTAWSEHQDHIADFWSSIFHKTGRFDGNPMKKHAALEGLTSEHFSRWLELFMDTVQTTLEPKKAEAMSAIAQRIGRSLQMGLAFKHEAAGELDHPFTEFSIRPSLSDK